MGLWSWFIEMESEYEEAGDEERIEMALCYRLASDVAEQDPDEACRHYRRGRHLAEQLGEPWWAYLYEVWNILTLVEDKRDFRGLLDDAIACYLRGTRPELEGHPWYLAIVNKLIAIYTEIDAEGYSDPIFQALAHADSVIPKESLEHRSVYMGEKSSFLQKIGRLDETWQTCLEHLELVESGEKVDKGYAANARAGLGEAAFYRRDWDNLEEYAGELESLARRCEHRQSDLSEAILWQAILAQREGDGELALRLSRQARSIMSSLGVMPSESYFDSLAYFHQLDGDYESALRVREQAFETIADHGLLGLESRLLIQRCRLRGLLGELTPKDLGRAREAVRKLRKPLRLLEEIREIENGNYGLED